LARPSSFLSRFSALSARVPWQAFGMFAGWWLVLQSFAVLAFFRFHLTVPDYAYGWTSQIRGMLPLHWQGFIALHARFDSGFYATIAQQGYTAQSASFLPFYPLLIRLGLSGVCAPLQALPIACSDMGVAFVISNVAALGAALVLYKLARLDCDDEHASRAVFYFLIFPSAFFLTGAYSESLFICLAASSLLAARRRWWAAAIVAGMLAMLTRATGLCLFAALLVEWRAARPWRDLRWLWLLAIPAAFVAFEAYLQAQGLSFFATEQLLFKRAPLNFGVLDANLDWEHVLAHPEAQVNLVLDVTLAVFVFLVSAVGAWRVRLSYGVFGALCVLLPFSSGQVLGLDRFALSAFTAPLILARSAGGWFDRLYTLAAVLLLALYTILFVQGYWAG
jgi:Mannosyltransferase (PIG-V)